MTPFAALEQLNSALLISYPTYLTWRRLALQTN